MDGNKKIKFLPENPADSFPSLLIYDARNCLIERISKANFKGLSSLKRVFLQQNEIQQIDYNTFEDLKQLKTLELCKKNNSLLGN